MKRVFKFKQGDILFNEGDASEAMYIVETGTIAITKSKEGTKTTLTELKEGDLFGEMAFFDNSTRSAGAVVVSPTASVVELPFASLKQQYEDMPFWIKTIITSTNRHLRSANGRIQELEEVIKNLKGY